MPTNRQEKLAEVIVENQLSDKPISKGEMLENVGYSEHLVKQPGRIINNPTVQALVEEKKETMLTALEDTGVTPAFVARKIKALLNKEQVVVKNNVTTGEIETVETGEMDVQAVKVGLDASLKIGVGGGYKDVNVAPTNQTINIAVINSPEVQAKIKDFEKDLREQLTSKPHAGSN